MSALARRWSHCSWSREMLERRKIKPCAVITTSSVNGGPNWTEIDIEAVIIRSSTSGWLDRRVRATPVSMTLPYQVISIDFIKSDSRCDVSIEQCPELVIVRRTHLFSTRWCIQQPAAALSPDQSHRGKPGQQMIYLTATPHSGKPEEFQSLLGLLSRPNPLICQTPPNSSAVSLRVISFSKRGDVEEWLGGIRHFRNATPLVAVWGCHPATIVSSEILSTLRAD